MILEKTVSMYVCCSIGLLSGRIRATKIFFSFFKSLKDVAFNCFKAGSMVRVNGTKTDDEKENKEINRIIVMLKYFVKAY